MMKRAQRLWNAPSRLPLQRSLIIGISFAASSSMASAQGFSITGNCAGSGVTIYSSSSCAAILTSNETGSASSSSTLQRVGDSVSTVYAGTGNTLNLAGTITIDGFNSRGVEIDEDNRLTLSGNVSATGQSTHGLTMNEDNVALISGNISTDGQNSHAIDAKLSNILDVSGSLSVNGESSRAIHLEQDNDLDMSGDISTTGRSSRGVYADTGNTVSISGTIHARGQSATGLIAVTGNTLNVSGRIRASGLTAHAVQLDSNNKLNVSGALIADGEAIYATGTGNTLNFTSGAFLAGGLEMLGSDTTVNINLGDSGPVAWQFDPGDISSFNVTSSGTQVFNSRTGLFVTYDEGPLLEMLTAPLDLIDDTDIQTPGAGWAIRLAYDTDLEGERNQPRIALARAIGDGDLRLGLARTSVEDENGGESSSTSVMAGYSFVTDSLLTLDAAAAISAGEIERKVNDNTATDGIATYSSDQTNLALTFGASMPLAPMNFGRVSLNSEVDAQLIYARSGEIDEGSGAGAAKIDEANFMFLALGGEVSAIFGATQVSAGLDARQVLSGELTGSLAGVDVTYDSDALDKVTPTLGASTIYEGAQLALDFDFDEETSISLSATWSL